MKPTINELEIFNNHSTTVSGEFDMESDEDKYCIVDTNLGSFIKDLRINFSTNVGEAICYLVFTHMDYLLPRTPEGIYGTFTAIIKLANEFTYEKFPNEAWGQAPNFLEWENELDKFVLEKYPN